ncbi:hypothetical protein D3C80_996140 [compost metagenome]
MFETANPEGRPQVATGASTHLIERILDVSCAPQFAFVLKWYRTTPDVVPEAQFKGVTPLAKTTVPAALVMVR